ncbi:SDR family oxidoreductase [Streptomyces drozdowiczii]|uniref:NAD(P)H-binding protein n=1 Tax=Streptomyces drozdowiczii TaxID=202862 RepID=A0ABY6PLP1_9ACTN|nr:NAD(P)H-binding protein [Streptomyces drozdowiczii]MCX0247789.1 NAD(P)H-binding protein [Streptomyces drozdowiczii]UZK52849.1 NAD(P)H-binding protein [Streptomyces drozdowiczii]
MILVTGATGNIGSALLRELYAHGAGPLRALTRDVSRAAFPAGVEAVEGDLAVPESLEPALTGARSLFLPSRVGPDAEIIAAARRAGVEHVVLVSSITALTHPHLGPAAENLAVEQLLKDSGMAWTVLRPTQFASNALLWAASIRAGETVRTPFADTGLPTIHPADIASVARVALTEPGHRGRTYALTGPEPMPARRQVGAVAAAIGRPVPFTEIGRQEARPWMAGAVGEKDADAVLDVMGGDANEELLAVRDTVRHVTGTPARPFRQWAMEHADAFR